MEDLQTKMQKCLRGRTTLTMAVADPVAPAAEGGAGGGTSGIIVFALWYIALIWQALNKDKEATGAKEAIGAGEATGAEEEEENGGILYVKASGEAVPKTEIDSAPPTPAAPTNVEPEEVPEEIREPAPPEPEPEPEPVSEPEPEPAPEPEPEPEPIEAVVEEAPAGDDE